ncbi:MAG TPA: NAD(P)/FAD-dependent oxidoreductase [Candidatus Limnocylindrales bacterium]|nr:NAD(P)/FAD-dependent oxidoreductase [Candidatus Limnocylindrales bacterium]
MLATVFRMRKIEHHRLPNLALAAKLTVSIALLFAWALYAASWSVAVLEASWASGTTSLMQSLGSALANLARQQSANYALLLVVHTMAIALLASVAGWLFRRTSMRRRARTAVHWLARGFFAFDLLMWVTVPFLAPVRPLATAFAAGATLLLGVLTVIGLKQTWIYARWRSSGVRRRVVIVGGGFAGLYTALGLDRRLGYHPDLDIEVLDRRNYFLFPPLLPSAAAGAIELRQVANPFRRIFESTNVRFRKASVEAIDPVRRKLVAHVEAAAHGSSSVDHDVEIDYDYLVLAPGSCNQTFGTRGVREHAFFMKELGDASAVRNQVIECFERAAAGGGEQLQRELLTFVVVGAGPTGVEVASEIHDLIFQVLLARYPEIDADLVRVILVQSGPQILPGWRDSVVRITGRQLSRMRCQVQLGCRVAAVTANAVHLSDGAVIPARTCIWCAGVAASPLLACAPLRVDGSGRAIVQADLRAAGFEDVFVLGDAAAAIDGNSGRALPPLGQVAFQQGSHTARNLVRLLRGKRTRAFRYFDHGSLVSVGEHFAAVDLFGVRIWGFAGWLIWRTLYLSKMVGFGNRLRIVTDWTLDLLVERSVAQTQERPSPSPLRGPLPEQAGTGAVAADSEAA